MNILKNFIFYIREVKKEDMVDKIVEPGQHVIDISLNNNLEAFSRSNLDLLLELDLNKKTRIKYLNFFNGWAAGNTTVCIGIGLALCKKITGRHNGI